MQSFELTRRQSGSEIWHIAFHSEGIVRLFILRAGICSVERVTLYSAWQHYLRYNFETWQISTSWSLQTKERRCYARGLSTLPSRFEELDVGLTSRTFPFLQLIHNWEAKFYTTPSNFRYTRLFDKRLEFIDISWLYLTKPCETNGHKTSVITRVCVTL
jgi:hypothetical protein